MNRWLIATAMVVFAFALVLGAGCGGGGIEVGGSTTVQPLAEKWAAVYEDADVTVSGGGSSAGVKGVTGGIFDIGAISRDLKSDETDKWPDLIPHAIALDGVAIVVHPSNPIDSLSIEEIRDIFATGTNSTWTVVSREEGSGTRETFEKKVMGEEEISAKVEFLPSNGAIKQKVATTSSAIGYVSLGYVDDDVKAVAVNGVDCATETVRNGTYPIARTLYFVTKGEPEGEVLDFINFCLSPEGQQIAEEEGYISIR